MKEAKDTKMLVEKAYKLGYEYEKTYRGCGQCIIAALQDVLNMRNDDIFKAATGLAGSAGMLCDAGCGSYMGGAIFLSFLTGRDRSNFADPQGVRFKTYDLVSELHSKFIAEYGSVICRDIHMKLFGRYYYMPDEDEYTKFDSAGGHTTVCPEVVGKGARWVVEILDKEGLIPRREPDND